MVAIGSGALAKAHEWEEHPQALGLSGAQTSRELADNTTHALQAPVLPAGTRSVRFSQVGANGNLDARLIVRTEGGRELGITLTKDAGEYVGRLPEATGEVTAVGVALGETCSTPSTTCTPSVRAPPTSPSSAAR